MASSFSTHIQISLIIIVMYYFMLNNRKIKQFAINWNKLTICKWLEVKIKKVSLALGMYNPKIL